MNWQECYTSIDKYKLSLQADIKNYMDKIDNIQKYENSINEEIKGRFLIIVDEDDITNYRNWCFENDIVCRDVKIKPKLSRPHHNDVFWFAVEFTSKADMVTVKLHKDTIKDNEVID